MTDGLETTGKTLDGKMPEAQKAAVKQAVLTQLLRQLRRPLVLVPAALLVVLIVVLFATRGQMEQLAFLRKGDAAASAGPVDQRTSQTAETLASLAVSVEEQRLAQQAQRLAEHETDYAFQTALREAAINQKVPTGHAAVMAKRVEDLKAKIKVDQAAVDQATAEKKAAAAASAAANPSVAVNPNAAAHSGTAADPAAAAPPDPAAVIPVDLGSALDVAQAQLTLDQDNLVEAEGEVARETGDQRGEIEQELAIRQAAQAKLQATSGAKVSAVTAAEQFQTLWGRTSAWFQQLNRKKLLQQARQQSLDEAAALTSEHAAWEARSAAIAKGSQTLGDKTLVGQARVKVLEGMAARRTIMSQLDDRRANNEQLADIYTRWEAQVERQHQLVGHLILESLAWVLAVVLVTIILTLTGRALVPKLLTEARQARTLETVVTLFIQIVGAGVVLLLTFGVPQQMPTIIGFGTAGLTVVFQDFILAFFGWFILMGGDGIRVNDWVEIDKIGGEVVAIGLFRTTLLETGNWTAKGHPTGRRVTLINSFAIRGQYFNFTTHGQWMWEEIRLNLPASPKVYELIGRMQETVEHETARETKQAALEWRRVNEQSEMQQYNAKPTIDLRPAAAGVDVIVRFVTSASERFEMSNRIYAALTELMRTEAVILPETTG